LTNQGRAGRYTMNNSIQPAKHLSDFKTQITQSTDSENTHEDAEYLCLSAELENYNNLLKNYQSDLHRWLCSAKNFEQFEQRISDELKQFSLNDWFFTKLCEPKTLSEMETAPGKDLALIFSHAFYECDIMLQHARVCDRPIYHSDVEAHVRSAPFSTELTERYLFMLALIKQLGYCDIFCIPVTQTLGGGRALFSVTSKDMNPLDFKDRAEECKDMLKVIGRVVNDVSSLKYSGHIVDASTRYLQLVGTQPFSLLAKMINYELSEEEKRSGISLRCMVKGLTNIREKILKGLHRNN
jgi:hypothetical protein